MTQDTWITVTLAVIALLGGAFGSKLLDRWFDRDRERLRMSAIGVERQFTDNEHARRWLAEQLAERDDELKRVRDHEMQLVAQVGDLAAKLGRQEERLNAQAVQIDELKTAVAKWGADYADMKSERDAYRNAKHDVDNKLTAETLRSQIAQKDASILQSEVERLRAQLALLTTKDMHP